MTTETQLVDAVLAAPDDDAPRLVYADWLLERGDPRGEFIIAQCTVARCERGGDLTCDEYRRARVTEALYRSHHEPRYLASIGLPRAVTRRGLVEQIAIDTTQLEDLAPTLARLPLRTIALDGAPTARTLRRLANHPFVEALAVTGGGNAAALDARAVFARLSPATPDHALVWPDGSRLPAAPFDEAVTHLRFEGQLDRLPPSVRSVRIDCERTAPSWIETLGGQVQRVERLELDRAHTTHALGLQHSWRFSKLRVFRMSGNPAMVGKRFELARWNSLAEQALTHLEASNFAIDEEVARYFADAPLDTVRWRGRVTVGALESFLAHPLRELEVDRCDAGRVDLLSARAPETLASLRFSSPLAPDRSAVEKLATCARLSRLVSLTFAELEAAELDVLLASPVLAGIPWLGRDGAAPR